MIGRVLLAAILAGLVGGLLMGVIQHVRLTPTILQAETFEHTAHGHAAAVTAGEVTAHNHDGSEWKPADGLERTLYTFAMTMLTAVGFGLLLAGISFVAARPIDKANGWLWGLCGFLAVALAPSIGLPPALPGMAEDSVQHRIVWWVGTAALTGLGLWQLSRDVPWPQKFLGLIPVLLPHLFGTSATPSEESKVPAALAAQFATNSLAANFVMWIAIGTLLGFILDRWKLNHD
jgi:cobalt transporter subunit CbtA